MAEIPKESINKFLEIIDSSKNIVAITGAGVSTESNIPDFRSAKGLYNDSFVSPEKVLSREFFFEHPDQFYDYYFKNLVHLDSKPNITHKFLADLEKSKKLKMIITQNIDGLHQKAGNKNVIELHGSIYVNKCTGCQKEYEIAFVQRNQKCSCGSLIKPNVVLYNEQYNQEILKIARKSIEEADVLIILGTSLAIVAVMDLINYFPGEKIIVLNRDKIKIEQEVILAYSGTAIIERTPLLEIYGEFKDIFKKIEFNKNTEISRRC